jgi:hypothetical protein
VNSMGTAARVTCGCPCNPHYRIMDRNVSRKE